MPTGLISQIEAGDKHAMRLQFEGMEGRLSALEQTAGLIGSNTDSQTPRNPVPRNSLLQVVKATAGWLTATVTAPQFVRTSTPGKVRGNLSRSPMIHELSYSTDPTFKTNVTTPPISVQTHYQIPTGGSALYFRIRSSVDGVNFNSFQQSGPHTA
jgi:hypothetical protein